MIEGGHVRQYRSTLYSPLWLMDPVYHRVWSYLVLTAQHTAYLFPTAGPYGIWVLPGQRITSLRHIAEGVLWTERGRPVIPNVKTISRVLEWLGRHDLITVVSNTNGTLVIVENWHYYNGVIEPKVTAKKQLKVTRRGSPSKYAADHQGNTLRTQGDKDNKEEKVEKKNRFPPHREKRGGEVLDFFLRYWTVAHFNVTGSRYLPTQYDHSIFAQLLMDTQAAGCDDPCRYLVYRAARYWMGLLSDETEIKNHAAMFRTRFSGLGEITNSDLGAARRYGIWSPEGQTLTEWVDIYLRKDSS